MSSLRLPRNPSLLIVLLCALIGCASPPPSKKIKVAVTFDPVSLATNINALVIHGRFYDISNQEEALEEYHSPDRRIVNIELNDDWEGMLCLTIDALNANGCIVARASCKVLPIVADVDRYYQEVSLRAVDRFFFGLYDCNVTFGTIVRSGAGYGNVLFRDTAKRSTFDITAWDEFSFGWRYPYEFKAEPASGSRFSHWQGLCMGNDLCTPPVGEGGRFAYLKARFVREDNGHIGDWQLLYTWWRGSITKIQRVGRNIWVLDGGGGAVRYDGKAWHTFGMQNSDGDGVDVLDGPVLDVLDGGDGTEWFLSSMYVGTSRVGRPYLSEFSLPDKTRWLLTSRSPGIVWWGVGSDFVFSRSCSTLKCKETTNHFDNIAAVWGTDSDLWIVGRAGIFRCSAQTGSGGCLPIPFPAKEIGELSAIHGSGDEVWVVGRNGVMRWNRRALPLKEYSYGAFAKVVSGGYASALVLAPNNVWLIGSDRISHWSENAWSTKDLPPEMHAENRLFFIDGEIWVSSGSRIYRYEGGTDR